MPSRAKKNIESPRPTTSRQRIVSGARTFFLSHGFRNVTMDEIALELAMSKKTLYAHFDSKLALIEAVIRAKFAELNVRLDDISPHAKENFPDTLQRMLACFQDQAQEIQPAFVRDIRRDAPEVFKLVEQLRQQAIELHFGRLFLGGRQRGWVRKDISSQVLIEILLAAAHAIMNPQKMAELKLTPQTGFVAISSVVLDGVLTPTGRARRSQ